MSLPDTLIQLINDKRVEGYRKRIEELEEKLEKYNKDYINCGESDCYDKISLWKCDDIFKGFAFFLISE